MKKLKHFLKRLVDQRIMTAKHIVVIEDNIEFLTVLTVLLEQQEFRVTALAQVSTIEELISLQADYFIIDEMLPVINGHILCIILKSKPQTREIPVILISASEQLEGVASLCEAEHFLTKPFDHQILLDILGEVESTL